MEYRCSDRLHLLASSCGLECVSSRSAGLSPLWYSTYQVQPLCSSRTLSCFHGSGSPLGPLRAPLPALQSANAPGQWAGPITAPRAHSSHFPCLRTFTADVQCLENCCFIKFVFVFWLFRAGGQRANPILIPSWPEVEASEFWELFKAGSLCLVSLWCFSELPGRVCGGDKLKLCGEGDVYQFHTAG